MQTIVVSTTIPQTYRQVHMHRENANVYEDFQSETWYANDVTIGGNNIDYKSVIAAGQDASSAYSMERHYLNPALVRTGSDYYVGNTLYRYTGIDTWTGGFQAASWPDTAEPDDIALKRLKRKLANDQSQFKALVPLGEHKELRAMVTRSAEVTTNFLKAVIGLKKLKFKQFMQASGDLWLQYSFAVKPTISDTEQLLATISDQFSKQFDTTSRYTGGAYKYWKDLGIDPGFTNGTSGCQITGTPWGYFYGYHVQYVAGVNDTPRSANNYLRAKYGLSKGDIIPAAYELTAFSWVLDYFSTTGDVIEDVFSRDPGTTIYCTKSSKLTCYAEQTLTPRLSSVSFSNLVGGPKVSTYDACLFRREVLGSIPFRALRVKSADEISRNAVNKVLNLASILVTKRKSGQLYR